MRYLSAITCAVLFLVLAALVIAGVTSPFDTAIRDWLHRMGSGALTQVALIFTFIGSAWIWAPATVIAVGVLWICARRNAAVGVLVCMAGAVLLDNGLKLAFHRARPVGFFIPDPRTYSFPSGHSLFAACFYGALATVLAAELSSAAARRMLWSGAIAAVLCIGWSRIYLGVHYPSDVMGGYLAGAAWVQFLRAAGLLPVGAKIAHRIA
jgi:undecaprenyl-diphosphatase